MKKQDKNICLMAFAPGRDNSADTGSSFVRLIGIGDFKILAVNPNKAELEKIYGTSIEKEVEYLSKDDTGLKQARIDFILSALPEFNKGIDKEAIMKVSYFLKEAPQYTKDNAKMKVINQYGETTWLLVEDVKNKVIPTNLSWFEGPFVPAYQGQEELVAMLKCYLNVPSKSYKNPKTGVVVNIDDKKNAVATLDEIASYFNGNFKELKTIIKTLPDNLIKLPVGVKTTADGKQYQDVFTQYPMKRSVSKFDKLEEAIKEKKDNGVYANTEFLIQPLSVYNLTPSTPSQPAPSSAVPVGGFFGN